MESAAAVAVLANYGALIEKNPIVVGVYKAQFRFGEVLVTFELGLQDYTGADLVISHMTTLPKEKAEQGFGSQALTRVLNWAAANNLKTIRAVQVQEESTLFWERSSFVRMPDPNPTNDYIYTHAGQ